MDTFRILLACIISLLLLSCSDDNGVMDYTTTGYTAVQQKALETLVGVWVSDEVKMEVEMGGQIVSMVVVPSDTIVFLSEFSSPKTFYAYDFLQGKDVENFVACGICEFRSGASFAGLENDCYFFVSPSGDALYIYGREKETLMRAYELRVESEDCFYAGVNNGMPIYFKRQWI